MVVAEGHTDLVVNIFMNTWPGCYYSQVTFGHRSQPLTVPLQVLSVVMQVIIIFSGTPILYSNPIRIIWIHFSFFDFYLLAFKLV